MRNLVTQFKDATNRLKDRDRARHLADQVLTYCAYK